jgi:tetratricopeptide (TPR) repeat protein
MGAKTMVRNLARPNEIVEEVHAIGNDTLANRSGDVTILLKLAALELARKDFEPAVRHLEAVRAASLTDLESRLQLATLYARFGRPELAGPVAEEAFKLAPDNPTALFEVGRARYGLGNFQPAVEAFAELSQQYPKNERSFLFRRVTAETG